MKPLRDHPNIITIIFAVLVFITVFAVQTWMTDRFGDTDTKSSVVDPPSE